MITAMAFRKPDSDKIGYRERALADRLHLGGRRAAAAVTLDGLPGFRSQTIS